MRLKGYNLAPMSNRRKEYMMPKSIMLEIKNCMDCPHCKVERTVNAGYAFDYVCKKVKDPKADYGFKVISGYVEWDREAPQDGEIPNWCPFGNREEVIEDTKYDYMIGL